MLLLRTSTPLLVQLFGASPQSGWVWDILAVHRFTTLVSVPVQFQPRADRMTIALDWLDRYLGPVKQGLRADGKCSWLLARGREMLEFFGPIQHNAHFVGRPILHIGLHKKESLTVRADVVDAVAQPTHQK